MLGILLTVSCDKVTTNEDDDTLLKSAYVLNWNSSPQSDIERITPYILAVDKPRGGNITCADVEDALGTEFNLCWEKLNYGESGFDGLFPSWIDVSVTDGKYVSFTVKNTATICYKVGAVIVKGGNSANVYYYEDGTTHDSGLASPILNNTSPAGLSNLTFCFYECIPEPLVIAVKSFYWSDGIEHNENDVAYQWGLSSGPYSAYPLSTDWCFDLEYNTYPGTSFSIIDPQSGVDVAFVSFVEGQVVITAEEGILLDRTYIFIGTLNELQKTAYCPNYTSWPSTSQNGSVQYFEMP